jgi:hypothetical protein
MAEADAVNDRWIYVTLMTLLVWAPLPLGSNRIWAIGILLVVALLLLAPLYWWWRPPSCQFDGV